MLGVGRDLKAQLIPHAGMMLLSIPKALQTRRQFQGCAWPGTCSCGSSPGAPCVPCACRAPAGRSLLPVPGGGSCHRSQTPLLPSPPAAPAPAQVLLSAHSCPIQALQSPKATSVTPQAPLVTHQPLCPSLNVPHWPRGSPLQGISSLEHGSDSPSVPSPSQVTWGWHRGWRTLTMKWEH